MSGFLKTQLLVGPSVFYALYLASWLQLWLIWGRLLKLCLPLRPLSWAQKLYIQFSPTGYFISSRNSHRETSSLLPEAVLHSHSIVIILSFVVYAYSQLDSKCFRIWEQQFLKNPYGSKLWHHTCPLPAFFLYHSEYSRIWLLLLFSLFFLLSSFL